MKNTYAKNIAVSSVFVAISVVLCFVASLFPTLSLSITATTGIATAVVLLNCGYRYSLLVYIASSILVLLLVPDKQCALYYLVLFGHYPMLRELTGKIENKAVLWGVKLIEAAILFLIVFLLSTYVLGVESAVGTLEFYFMIILILPVFVIYDICLGRIMQLYVLKHRFR